MSSSPDLLATDLPDFLDPPVVEVAIAVEFAPVPSLDTLALVALHETWRAQFPRIELQPPIASPTASPTFPVELIPGVPPVRLWSLNDDEDFLLQVQDDRLIVNWRRRGSESEAYPHYLQLANIWSVQWEQFLRFLSDRGIPLPRASVAEVSYVNVINLPVGLSPNDAVTIFGTTEQPWRVALLQARQVLEVAVGPYQGHLSLQAEHAQALPGQLNLTVVTRLAAEDQVQERELRPMLDAAHVLSVEAFAASTTATMHRHWGRQA